MLLSFPKEEQLKNRLNEQLADYFDYAKRLLRFWLEDDLDAGFASAKLSPIVLHVFVGMSVKACRQFRSVIELCERGEAVDGSIIARSMFETALVVGFVAKPRFTPYRYENNGKRRPAFTLSGRRLTREYRATLYLAHEAVEPERFVARNATRSGIKRYVNRVKRIADDDIARAYKKELGPEGVKLLMSRPYTYSGLSIGNLARSLGKPFSQWYDFVYGKQSAHVHPADWPHHIKIDEDGNIKPGWHESPEYVRQTLLAAVTMFYTTIGILNHHIGFGVVMNTALDGFYREYKRLIDADRSSDRLVLAS